MCYVEHVVVDEARLLEAWRGGDVEAGDALFRRLFGPLRRFFANKVGDRHQLEELLARTLELLVRRRDAFEGRSGFRTYAFGIARNVLRDHYRTRIGLSSDVDVESLSVTRMGAGPLSLLVRAEEHQLLLHALRRVPLEQQIVLELYFWEHMTGPAIAELLEISLETIHSRKRLGRHRLRRELERLAHSPELAQSTIHDLDDWVRGLRDHLSARGVAPP